VLSGNAFHKIILWIAYAMGRLVVGKNKAGINKA